MPSYYMNKTIFIDVKFYQCDLFLVISPQPRSRGWCPHGVMVKAMDCGIVVSEFKLQLHYHVFFRTDTPRKGMNPLILPAMG